MKKLVLMAATLTMVLTVTAPVALAQTEPVTYVGYIFLGILLGLALRSRLRSLWCGPLTIGSFGASYQIFSTHAIPFSSKATHTLHV